MMIMINICSDSSALLHSPQTYLHIKVSDATAIVTVACTLHACAGCNSCCTQATHCRSRRCRQHMLRITTYDNTPCQSAAADTAAVALPCRDRLITRRKLLCSATRSSCSCASVHWWIPATCCSSTKSMAACVLQLCTDVATLRAC
jgi:hypothetical protein